MAYSFQLAPASYDTYFPNTPTNNFWTSTTFTENILGSYCIDFNEGYISHFNKQDKSSMVPNGTNSCLNVRCVSN